MPQSNIRFFLVVFFLLGVYTGLPLKLEGFPVPAIAAGMFGCILLYLNKNLLRRFHLHLFLLLIVVMIPGMLANFGDGLEMQRLKGAVQLLYSVTISLGCFLELRRWDKDRVANLFYWMAIFIVLGCFLEVYTSFKEVSDSFRSYAFDTHLYDASFRDELIFGRDRPKLFTSEPSYVALFLFLSLTVSYCLTTQRFANLKLAFLALMGTVLIGSPIVMMVFAVPIIVFLLLQDRQKVSNVSWGKMLGGEVLFGVALLVVISSVLSERLEQISEGSDDSFSGRITAPPLATYLILSKYPLFGVGIDAKAEIASEVGNVFARMEVYVGDEDDLGNSVTNSFWLHWIYFGLLGGVCMGFLIYKLMKLSGVRHPWFPFVMTIISWQAMGGYVDPRSWFFFFMFMLIPVLRSPRSNQLSRTVPAKILGAKPGFLFLTGAKTRQLQRHKQDVSSA